MTRLLSECEADLARRPQDLEAAYRLAVVLLRSRGLSPSKRVLHLLGRVVKASPDHARAKGLLGALLFIEGDRTGLALLQAAYSLDSTIEAHKRFYLEALLRFATPREFRSALRRIAARDGHELKQARRRIRSVGWKVTDRSLLDALYPAAFNLLDNQVWTEVTGFLGGPPSPREEHQLASKKRARLNVGAIPARLRPLAKLAAKWGVGDDHARHVLLSQMTQAEQRQLRSAATFLARREIDRWLQSIEGDPAYDSKEARAFFWLLQAYEELGPEHEAQRKRPGSAARRG